MAEFSARGRGPIGFFASVFGLWTCLFGAALAAPPPSLEELRGMSLEQLANVEVTSVSKRSERLSDAPAAVYVINHDEIVRSGAKTLPEILRLAPNLQVALINANSYAITARGFNGNAADKLLVLIDGRSVYTPWFGGVRWDEQDVPVEDIDHIEVISGPGATLWGANAVNGVINIITRNSRETQGGLLELSAGNRESHQTLQYGGRVNDHLSFRAYVDGLEVRSDKLSTGANAHDGWAKTQGGFRLDWTPANDHVMVEGDVYGGSEQQVAAAHVSLSGGHLQLNWTHPLEGSSSIQLLAYIDDSQWFTKRSTGLRLDTYDLELQHNFSLGGRQSIVWGGGVRVYHDHFENLGSVIYLTAKDTQTLADIFAQDTIALTRSVDLTAGLKLEKDPYSGVTPLPNVRLSWKAAPNALLWAAVSRAVRAPTLFDEALNDTVIPSVLILEGNPQFRAEKLTAFEIGGRWQIARTASLSASAYYNVYHDLRSAEWLRLNALPLLLRWGNLMEGRTYGVEVWGKYQPTDWWRLSAGFNLQHLDLGFKPGASSVNNTAEAGDDPHAQASLQSYMNLGHRISWRVDLRYVGALPDPRIPSYTELNTDLTWAATDRLDLYLSGANLLHAQHLEYELAGAKVGDEVPRSISVGTRLRF